MKVHWTDNAEGHLDAIHDYIARNSLEYAKIVVDKLTRRSQQISLFPLSGRVVPEFDIEQLREVIEESYRIIYYIKPDQIDVLAVIHGAMNSMKDIEK
ncbi:MAG: type II toxin-antitoxin system RelE/ParE family toxin [Thermodesulfovibrionia bacterium]|nr:type II toxin-antitoxin system RelE/ParE family toxin [Thermodesulfovibrionia bacterium]